jgi:hypothetical protein
MHRDAIASCLQQFEAMMVGQRGQSNNAFAQDQLMV